MLRNEAGVFARFAGSLWGKESLLRCFVNLLWVDADILGDFVAMQRGDCALSGGETYRSERFAALG